MIEKTVKTLAEEIGVSKQRIQQIIDKLPENKTPKKRGNRYVLTELDSINIKIAMGLVDPELANIDKYRQISTNTTTNVNSQEQQESTNIDNNQQNKFGYSAIIDKEQQESTNFNKEKESIQNFNDVFELIKSEIGEKNEQIKEKDKQITQLQKLLENQQVLTLQAQEKIKLLEESKAEENEPSSTETFREETPKKQGFFAKWFK